MNVPVVNLIEQLSMHNFIDNKVIMKGEEHDHAFVKQPSLVRVAKVSLNR